MPEIIVFLVVVENLLSPNLATELIVWSFWKIIENL
jgi:hypothetical protein